MSCRFEELDGLKVTVDRVVHAPHLEAPEDRPHPFIYYITIHNGSDRPLTIKGRKWIVTDASGHCIVVEGDGVVGRMPRLEPGRHFTYNSYHVIGSNSTAEGSFFGLTDDGAPILTRIPPFTMQVP